MKTKFYYFIALLLLSHFAVANSGWHGKHTKQKTIIKEYTVNPDALLKVANSYGNISISTYTGATVQIEVQIKTNGNSMEKVQEKLDDITVDFQASSTLVAAKTIVRKSRSSSWWHWGTSNNVNMEINYIIKLPITNSVDLDNDYGNINLDRLEGHAKISCDYGKITTKELLADHNVLSFDYTNNCYFEYIKSGTITADYSSFTVSKANTIELKADYTNSIIEVAENVTYTCDYGAIKINKANNIHGKGDYLTARFGDIYKSIQLAADYGSIKIDNMTANAGNITINSDYTGITIGYDAAYYFEFDVKLEYASLRGAEDFQFRDKKIESTDQYYQGYRGNGDAKNRIKIASDYGSVTFKQN